LKELERVKNLSPRGLYVKAVAHNSRWEFSQAAELYESIIEQKLLSGIDLLKVKHMLAVTLSRMGKDFKRADALLTEIEAETKNSQIDINSFTRAVLRDKAICALEE